MKLNLGFDLDEVVVDLTSEIERYLKDTYNVYWPMERFTHHDMVDNIFHKDKIINKQIQEDLTRCVHTKELQFSAHPCNGAVGALNLFKKAGHTVHFITSRPKQNLRFTIDWLEKYNIPFDTLEVLGLIEEKGWYCKGLDMFVDDCDKHLQSMYRFKKNWQKGLLLFDKPWNKAKTKFNRVKDWKEISKHIMEE